MRANSGEGEEGADDRTTRGAVSRRTLLRAGTAAAGAGLLATGVGSATEAPDPIPDWIVKRFDRVIDVTEAGADDTGERSILGALERLRDNHELQDGTLLYFPPGRYYMDAQFRMTGFEKFGMYGHKATLVPANYHDITDGKHKLFRLGATYNPGRHLHVQNFDVDQTAPDTGVRVVEAAISKRLEVRDVHVHGRHDSGVWGPGRFVLTEPDATGVVHRFTAPDGGEFSKNTPDPDMWRGPSGFICNAHNKGRMTFKDCVLGGFPDNGLYAAGGDGQIRVWRGLYKNSNAANVRVGAPGSEIVGITVEVDQRWPDTVAQRGIRVEKAHGIDIRNCDVRIATDTPNSHGISIQWDAHNVFVKNTDVVMDSPAFNHGIVVASRATDPTFFKSSVELNTPGGTAFYIDGEGTDDEHAMLAQVDITGDAGHRWNRAAIYNQRNNVEFRVVNVEQTGGRKRRALENFGDNVMVYYCDFYVNQFPIIDNAAGGWVEDCTLESAHGRKAVRLTDSSANVYLKQNRLAEGILDEGCGGLRMVGNEFN